MGFLRRFLSLGGKKNKKQRPQIIHNVPLDKNNHLVVEDNDAVVNRLLRSSSARYHVVEEVDYNSLPPLPHPINNVIQTPSASTTSLASTTVSQRGTYSVRVHQRQYHTRPELEIPRLDEDTAKDTSQLLRLRSDPSVASLLDIYDEHGHLSAQAFSNSPPAEGRAQTKRSGSTLRQLLGDPSDTKEDGDPDSDISWAEQVLRDNASSVSSLAIQTPNDFDDKFPSNPLIHDPNDMSFTSDHDLSGQNPAISSMEVELSVTSESISFDDIQATPVCHKTPRRASQVFDFLSKRQSVLDTDRPLPELPSAFSSPSDKEDSPRSRSRSRFSADTSCDSLPSAPAIPKDNDTNSTTLDPAPDSSNDSVSNSVVIHEGTQAHKVKIIMTNPTTVMVTAPTPSAHTDVNGNLPRTPSRIPRGPRAQMRKVSYGNLKERRHDDPFTHIPSRRRKSRSRITSASSCSLNENEPPATARPIEKTKRATKQSDMVLSARADIPFTPVRTNTTRSSLFRTAVSPGVFQPPEAPSPASSSEMSPVGQRMMLDARKQRTKNRERQRMRSSNVL